jgi:fibrobacter succinogenes major domain (fib_succ_major)
MDRQKFLNLLNNDIDFFISNYLIDGNLEGLIGVDDIGLYITDCFPYLSTLYLILSNYDSIESNKFIERHSPKLHEETNQLKARLGYFLCEKKEVDTLKLILETSQKENEEKETEVQLLKEDIEILKSKNQSQEQRILTLQNENNNLIHKISELELKLNEASHSPMQEYPREDKDKDGGDFAASAECSDLIDMGTSVLWRAYNLGAENNLEDGDYYSWGAVNNAEYFGKSVWGYKQVIKKSISGLSDCDAARSLLGERYRIPTVEEWKELLAICDYKSQIVTYKGRNFVKLVSTKTHNTLLLPYIGHMESDVCSNRLAQYWTSEQNTGKSASICQFHNSGWNFDAVPKWYGLPIRPVYVSGSKPNIIDANDKLTSSIRAANSRIQAAAQTASLRIWSKILEGNNVTSNTTKRKYPAKSEINESNIFNILIKDCLPYGNYVFEGDIVRDINLDLNKLNKILKENYSIQPLLFGSIASMRLKDLKALILSKLSK